MRILHLSDLHLGKRVCETSMLKEQEAVFDSIIDHLRSSLTDAVIIAGDIYDRSIPPESAVVLFSSMIERISDMGITVMAISGNHDSPERLSFASGVMKKHNIHFVTNVRDSPEPVTLHDEYGTVNFYLLPYLRPNDVSNVYDVNPPSYTDAAEYMVQSMNIDSRQRNVIVSHQFVAGASLTDTETCIGGTEAVSAQVYEAFDYAALGHLHTPQSAGRKTIRYCGTPLKYSASEVNHSKSMTIVTLAEKGNVSVETIPLVPLHDMRRVKGSVKELCRPENATEDYIYAVVTDTNELSGIASMLRQVYPNLISIDYAVLSERYDRSRIMQGNLQREKTPLEVFTELYELQHGGSSMSDIQLEIMKDITDGIEKEGDDLYAADKA